MQIILTLAKQCFLYPSNAERVSDTRLDTQEGQIKLCIAKHSCAKSRNKKPMNHYNSWVYILNHYKTVHMITKNWWAQTDLNCRPTDYESVNIKIKNQKDITIKLILSYTYLIYKVYYSLFLLINIY